MKIKVTDYWMDQPPEPSANIDKWVKRINEGWKMNRRISQMGYHERCEFFGVYLWEYFNVLCPLLGIEYKAKVIDESSSLTRKQ